MKPIVLPNDTALSFIREQLQNGNQVAFPVKGTSMRPFFQDGKTSVMLIKKNPPYKRFDVVLFEAHPGTMVLHRIVQAKPPLYFIQGDALKTIDQVKEEAIVGVVIHHDTNHRIIQERSFWNQLFVRKWHFLRGLRYPLLGILRRLGR
jgi:hypothetical protein